MLLSFFGEVSSFHLAWRQYMAWPEEITFHACRARLPFVQGHECAGVYLISPCPHWLGYVLLGQVPAGDMEGPPVRGKLAHFSFLCSRPVPTGRLEVFCRDGNSVRTRTAETLFSVVAGEGESVGTLDSALAAVRLTCVAQLSLCTQKQWKVEPTRSRRAADQPRWG